MTGTGAVHPDHHVIRGLLPYVLLDSPSSIRIRMRHPCGRRLSHGSRAHAS